MKKCSRSLYLIGLNPPAGRMEETIMEIIKRSTMPNGVKIQLEHWMEYGFYMIGAYPPARFGGYWVKPGEPFRLSINTDAPEADFAALESGRKSLEDMAPQYYNGARVRYYMGMEGVTPA